MPIELQGIWFCYTGYSVPSQVRTAEECLCRTDLDALLPTIWNRPNRAVGDSAYSPPRQTAGADVVVVPYTDAEQIARTSASRSKMTSTLRGSGEEEPA